MTIIAPAQPLWRALALNRNPEDGPFWAILHVSMPGDILPADLHPAVRNAAWPQTQEWVRQRLGQRVQFEPWTQPCLWTLRAARRPQ